MPKHIEEYSTHRLLDELNDYKKMYQEITERFTQIISEKIVLEQELKVTKLKNVNIEIKLSDYLNSIDQLHSTVRQLNNTIETVSTNSAVYEDAVIQYTLENEELKKRLLKADNYKCVMEFHKERAEKERYSKVQAESSLSKYKSSISEILNKANVDQANNRIQVTNIIKFNTNFNKEQQRDLISMITGLENPKLEEVTNFVKTNK